MITVQEVQTLSSPARGRSSRTVEPSPGLMVGDMLPPDWDPLQARALLRGRPAELTAELRDGDVLTLVRTPGVSYLINALISFAISALLAPDIPDTQPETQRSKTYGFNGITNRWGESTRVPIVFGRHRTSGHVIGYYTETLGAQAGQHVFMLLAMSEGPVHELAGRQVGATVPVSPNEDVIFVEHNDAARYSGLEITAGLGLDGGTTHAGFLGRFIQRSIGQELGLAYTRLEQPYTAGGGFIVVEDNSAFFAGDTIQLSYSNSTFSGDAAIILSVDPDGKRIWLDAPLPSSGHPSKAAVVSFRPVVITGDGTTGKGVRFNINCPSGIYYLDVNSGTQPWQVKVQVEVKASAGSVWSSLGVLTLTNDAVGSYWQTFSFDLVGVGLDGTDIDFRLTKKTRPPTNGATIGDQVDAHSVVFVDEGLYAFPGTAVLGIHGIPNAQINNRLPEISAIVKGVKFDKPDDDAGSSFSAATLAGDEYRNPAWIALEILRNPLWGAGQYIADENIDFGSFREWAAYCEETVLSGYAQSRLVDDAVATAITIRVPLGAGQNFAAGDALVVGYGTSNEELKEIDFVTDGSGGNGSGVTPFDEDFDTITLTSALANPHGYGEIVGVPEARCLCDLVCDKDTTLWDALAKASQSGRAIIVKTGNTYRAVVDKPRDPVQMFTEANINKGTWRHQVTGRVDLPNVIEATFLNEEENYERGLAPAYDHDAIDSGEVQSVEQIDLFGITRPGQAFRDAEFYLRKKRLLRERAEFECGLDGLAAEAGDRILVQHRAMTRGHGCKIIDARQVGAPQVTEVKLDDDVALDSIAPGGLYELKVSDPSDDSIDSAQLLNPGAARGTWIRLGADIGGSELIGRLAAYGPLGTFTVDLVIERIETTEDLQRKVICTKYDPRVYEDNVSGEPPVNPNGMPRPGYSGQWEPEPGLSQWNGGDPVTPGYGSGGGDLVGVPVTVQGPDGTPAIAVALSWNPLSSAHSYGSDVYPQEFRSSGTWNPATRTLAGDTSSSDLATEGGGRREAGMLLGRYNVFFRRLEDTGDPDAWKLAVAWTDKHSAQVHHDFERGATYEFAVVPGSSSGASIPPEDGAIVEVDIPTGISSADQIRLGTPDAPEVVYREQAHQPPLLDISWPAASAALHPGLLPDFFEVRIGGGWLTGRLAGRTRGGPFLLADLCPGADEVAYVRARLKGGQWSGDAAVVETDWGGPLHWETAVNQSEAPGWSGTLTNLTDAGDELTPDSGETEHVYETGTIDAGLLDGTLRRMLWICPMLSITDAAMLGSSTEVAELPPNPQAGFDEPIGRRYTAEGDLYDDDVLVISTSYRTSADGTTWSDWIPCNGATEVSARYYQARLEITRDGDSNAFQIDDLTIVILDSPSPVGGGGS